MKNNKTQNIENCSRCGLCQGVCPIYDIIKNENVTARGRLMQILGLKKGDLTLNRKILNSFDLCLNCEKCKLNCPSGVNTTDIFNREKKLGTLEKFLHSRFVFETKMLLLKLTSVFKKRIKYEEISDIVYFEGCVAHALKNGLNLKGIKLKNGNFNCCGLPYLTKGRLDIYNDIMLENEKIIENSTTVVFDCATCYSAVKNYNFKNPKNREKLIFYTDFFKNISLMATKPTKATFHMPCHLEAAGTKLSEAENIIKSIKNLTYLPLNNPQDCCGFGGDFFIRHPVIAYKISMKKAQSIINTGADIVLTACPICVWSLKFSLFICKIKGAKNVPKVYDFSKFINKFCTMAPKTAPERANQDVNMYALSS